MTKSFTKLLVARHSPQNGCHAQDGAILYVEPRPTVPLKDHLAHHFVAHGDDETRCKYGWVSEVEPFGLDDFIRTYLAERSISDSGRDHLEIMLRSVAKLNPGTPVAATYSSRGVEKPRMEFTVHRVVF